jgi:hypothetical protein
MSAIKQERSIEALQEIITSKGIAVSIGKADVKKVYLSTSYSKDADQEKRLDILLDLLLTCGEDYDIDATMVYGTIIPDAMTEDKELLVSIINKADFSYQFDSNFISGNMVDNICIHTKTNAAMERILASQGDNFDSMGEGENGKTCLLLVDDTANRACYFLEHALNNQGFDSALAAELDQNIRSGALTVLKKTSEA